MSMQPIYLTGHSRPVLKVMYNYDGDRLFTCSDDKTVCMYNTTTLERIGIFQIQDSCKSIDVTKDSKYMFAVATTKGVKIFDTSNGDMVAEIVVPGRKIWQVELSYSDKYFIVIYESNDGRENQCFMRIYDTKKAIEWGVKKEG